MDENHELQPAPNPLMQRIQMPGETFTLPSGGLFYKDGELKDTVKNAEVRVYPMTSLDEITMKTPDLLFSGDAVREVFSRCVPDVVKPNQLLAKDVDFLLICLRKVSYGDEFRVPYIHDCDGAKEHTYNVDINTFIRNSIKIDPTTYIKEFTVEIPNGQTVLLQPMRYQEFIRIMQSNDDGEKTPEEIRDAMAESLSSVISKVDEVTDQKFIIEWLKGIKPLHLNHIHNHIDGTLEWGASMSVDVQCKDCGKNMKVQAPMNPLSFFT